MNETMLHIIPVIDLMQAQVVHAKRGLREAYRPIQSQLCDDSQPLAVLDGLMELYPFQTIYIADIDAILGVNNNTSLVESLSARYPKTTFWLDNGVNAASGMAALCANPNIKPVIGSENIRSLSDYLEIQHRYTDQYVLSLDYADSRRLGVDALHEDAAYWPDTVICMTLEAVGSTQGIAVEQLEAIVALSKSQSGTAKLYAAGGARDMNDIKALQGLDVAGVLVATALHTGAISRQELTAFYGKK